MAKRGRRSGASDNVVPFQGRPQRPKAPASLSKRAADEWSAIVEAMPADWFLLPTHALLEGYCNAVATGTILSASINDIEASDGMNADTLKRYYRLLGMRVRNSQQLMMFGTKLRLTQQSRYTAKSAATAVANVGTGPRPWHYGFDHE